MKPGHELLLMPFTLPWRSKKAGHDLTYIRNIEDTKREEGIMVVGKLLIPLLNHSLTDLDRYEMYCAPPRKQTGVSTAIRNKFSRP